MAEDRAYFGWKIATTELGNKEGGDGGPTPPVAECNAIADECPSRRSTRRQRLHRYTFDLFKRPPMASFARAAAYL
eukprot:6389336-Prymnesium_polylepis.2